MLIRFAAAEAQLSGAMFSRISVPRGGIALVAVALGALAIGVAAAPRDVPALTIPGSQAGMPALSKAGMSQKSTAARPGSAVGSKTPVR